MTRESTEADFLKDVAAHEMEVLRDDGVYRHIRFKKPGTGCMHFDLVTWPGYLGADGDSGGYRKQAAAHDFSHFVSNDVGNFYFQDFWEHDLTEYTFRFVWCCYALAWGIMKYDEARKGGS